MANGVAARTYQLATFQKNVQGGFGNNVGIHFVP